MEDLAFNISFKLRYSRIFRFARRYGRIPQLTVLFNSFLTATSTIYSRIQYQITLRQISLQSNELTIFGGMDALLNSAMNILKIWKQLSYSVNIDEVSITKAYSYVVSYRLLLQTSGTRTAIAILNYSARQINLHL